MCRALVGVLGAVLFAILAAAPVRGSDAPASPSAGVKALVEKCLKDLTSDDYETREAARKRLQGVSREARPLLEARRDDPDPEVRRTVEALLEDLGESSAPPPAPGALGNLGLVTFAAEGRFSEVIDAWAKKVGGRFVPPPTPPEVPLRISVEGVPYFEGLAAILSPAALDLADGFDEVGQAALVQRERGAAPLPAFSGPFRFDVETVTTTRSLRSGVRPRHSLLLRIAWAPDVQVVTFSSPEVVQAVDEKGGTFGGADGAGTTYGLGGGRRVATFQMSLDPAEGTAGSRVASLDARMRVRVRNTRRSVAFPDLAGPEAWPRTRESEGSSSRGKTKVVLESFGADPDRKGWSMAVLTATLARGVASEGVTASLSTSDGGVRPLLELSSRVASSDGVLRLTLRAPGGTPDASPAALDVAWFEAESEVLVPFALKDIPLR